MRLRRLLWDGVLALGLLLAPCQQAQAIIGCRHLTYTCAWFAPDVCDSCNGSAVATVYICEDGSIIIIVQRCCLCA